MVGFWIIVAAIFVSGSGLLFALVSFVYIFVLLLTVFKYASLAVLSAFIVTALSILAPVMVLFFLFDGTKGMFQQWVKTLIGYMLYPAIMFAFLSLMLATFDSIYFGDLGGYMVTGNVTNIVDICKAQGETSLYCSVVLTIDGDPCSMNLGSFISAFTQPLDLGLFGTITVLKSGVLAHLSSSLLMMMLFALIFYLFLGSMSSFIAILIGIHDLGGISRGGMNAANIVGGGAKSLLGKGVSKLGSGASKVSNKARSAIRGR